MNIHEILSCSYIFTPREKQLYSLICFLFVLSLYAKYYFALRSLVEKQDFRQRYNRMVGGVDTVAQSEALKVQKRTELVKEEALLQLSRSM